MSEGARHLKIGGKGGGNCRTLQDVTGFAVGARKSFLLLFTRYMDEPHITRKRALSYPERDLLPLALALYTLHGRAYLTIVQS